MDAPGCHECGATWTRKGPDGCCAWTGGCETRIQQAEARDAVFDADYRFHFVPLPCGHTAAEHRDQWAAYTAGAGLMTPGEAHQRALDFIDRMTGVVWDDPDGDEPG